jgi:hypothetical protein
VGEIADWRADTIAAIPKAEPQWGSGLPEAQGVSHETCLALKGCLVFRLGEAKLAENLWVEAAGERGLNALLNRARLTNSSATPAPKLGETDPYLEWASDWAWGLFDRGICAHMRGDDGLALASALLLSAARPQIEEAAERRGFTRQRAFNNGIGPRDGKYQDYLEFLGPLPVLLTDQERRAQRRTPVRSVSEIMQLTNQADRISALIDELDQVAVRQFSQPGGLGPWDMDPIFAAILKQGQPAVEPLLQCLESNSGKRLTRSVSFGRDFARDRWLHPVSEPIGSALHVILAGC